MITPKPATVFDLFNGHPERWTKGAVARAASGNTVSPTNPAAIRWSLNGAIKLVYGNRSWMSDAAEVRVWSCLPADATDEFNDAPSTTFDMMLAKVKGAGI